MAMYRSADRKSSFEMLTFESISFLKTNYDCWDAAMFEKAVKIARNERTRARLRAHEALVEGNEV